jgi:hypothetical protein
MGYNSLSFNDLHSIPLEEISINQMVSVYLMSSYLYYVLDDPLMFDSEYDFVCKKLLASYDQITHIHKHLIDKDLLRAGSGFDIKYTNMIISASKLWIKEADQRRGRGGSLKKNIKKSNEYESNFKTVNIIANNTEELNKSIREMKFADPSMSCPKKFLSNSVIAEVEYLDI